ncbi:helix-turn-helix transcriptional regulator [Paenibacillus durus]|uniref:Excisionase n=1 Tax=Paenibacillus durus TaxID=44251 RepID=A0A089HKN2_PAEDU|nr:helix-turn-helix transcriptional regulator [Paenibacillus durus]AIQ12511.1 hypothetical protein PDUR_11825 [Paenibacillus durus]
MTQDTFYTIDEVAKLLRVSKLKVYDMVKKRELPSFRVGRQIRIDSTDFSRYKDIAKETAAEQYKPSDTNQYTAEWFNNRPRPFVIAGEDMSLDLVARYMTKGREGFRPLRYCGAGLANLRSLYRGEVDMVGCHLFDFESGEYNIPYVKRLLMGVPVLVIRLSRQYRGIYVQRGNPLRIQNSNDLAREDICYYARNSGSGTNLESTDLEAALQVANGAADASIGIESCAFKANVDFVPLTEELHDLVILRTPQNLKLIGEVADIIRSEPFRKELSVIGGYDLTESGRVVYEAI